MFRDAWLTFQSTPPVQGATGQSFEQIADAIFQSTPPVQGATWQHDIPLLSAVYFNPRPLCRGRPSQLVLSMNSPSLFQSTPPVQGATFCLFVFTFPQFSISIHAPCAGGDASCSPSASGSEHFNPRPLCRGRLVVQSSCKSISTFQSTPPVQGATPTVQREAAGILISIHAPCAGGDPRAGRCRHLYRHFNPRPLCRGRH